MIRLKNLSEKQIEYTVTREPFSAPHKSPNPSLVPNPMNPSEKIPDPSLLTQADTLVIRSGEIVELTGGKEKSYNTEQGEYLYYALGVIEDGGTTIAGRRITNRNTLVEVDGDGNEIKDNLFVKYRGQANIETASKVLRVEKE